MTLLIKRFQMRNRLPFFAPEGEGGGANTPEEGENGEGGDAGGDAGGVLGKGVLDGEAPANEADTSGSEADNDQSEDEALLDTVPEDGAYTFNVDAESGFELTDEAKTAYSAAFAEAGMTQRQVNAAVDAHQNLLLNMSTEASAAADAQMAAWVEEAKADPEMGKDWTATTTLANQALSKIADDDVVEQLNRTGLGNHPAFIRMFHKLGKMMGEDSFSNGSQSETVVPAHKSWYDKTTPETKRA